MLYTALHTFTLKYYYLSENTYNILKQNTAGSFVTYYITRVNV